MLAVVDATAVVIAIIGTVQVVALALIARWSRTAARNAPHAHERQEWDGRERRRGPVF